MQFKEDARVFPDAGTAIKHCLSVGIRDVRLAKFTEAWKLKGYLEPFGAGVLDLSTGVIRAELLKSIEENRALFQKQRELTMQIDRVAAELKERKSNCRLRRSELRKTNQG